MDLRPAARRASVMSVAERFEFTPGDHWGGKSAYGASSFTPRVNPDGSTPSLARYCAPHVNPDASQASSAPHAERRASVITPGDVAISRDAGVSATEWPELHGAGRIGSQTGSCVSISPGVRKIGHSSAGMPVGWESPGLDRIGSPIGSLEH